MRGKRIDDSAGRVCSACNVFKPRAEFYETNYIRRDGSRPLQPLCIECTSERNKVAYRRDPEAQLARVRAWTERQMAEDPEGYRRRLRENRLRREYGLSVEDWDRLHDEQLGRCAICLTPLVEVRPAVDHCHTCDAVRGILCDPCNMALGLLGDDVERILRAAEYVNTHSSGERRRDEDATEMPSSVERG